MLQSLGPFSMVTLIFGGCCSNVFALEALVRSEPSSGLLITLTQFYFTALAAYPTQFSSSGTLGLRKPSVPLWRWAYTAVMFYAINMLNNWAFAYSISVPVHIILRSFGSVSTMLAGVLRGKRYSPLQVFSVALLTVGVLVSAWADSISKAKKTNRAATTSSSETSSSDFASGLAILIFAQFLSAYMGAYVEDTYAQYKASWTENLFYIHALSLPLFLPLSRVCWEQYNRLIATPPIGVKGLLGAGSASSDNEMPSALAQLAIGFAEPVLSRVPRGLLFLLINATTQLLCISGVNVLSARSSAVTVTIVLNIRKLVSFIFSTILFDHKLSALMVFGATLVFGSGALYGWETSWRLPQRRRAEAEAKSSLTAAENEKENEQEKALQTGMKLNGATTRATRATKKTGVGKTVEMNGNGKKA